MDEIRNAISAGNENFMAAFKRGDVAGVAACYTADGQLLPPNSPAQTGAEAIQAFWQGAMSLGIKEAKLETLEVEAHGNLAVEVGQYTLTILAEGGQPVTDVGKYIVVWKNDGGTWKLHRDIWNSSTAAA